MMLRCFIVIILLLYLMPLQPQTTGNNKYYYDLFSKAEGLFNGEANEQTDSLALQYYQQIIRNVKPSPATAKLLFDCNERAGILMQSVQADSKEALNKFYQSLALFNSYHLADSITFRLLLSLGNSHYTAGLFDSSLYYLKRAEKVITTYSQAGYPEDLYNSFGALYNEQGNFKQSGIYFTKALEIVQATRPQFKEAQFAMSANIASAVRLSGALDSAALLYKKLLSEQGTSLPILNNLARIYLSKQQPDSALLFLKLIKTVPPNYTISYYNSLGAAYLRQNKIEDALRALKKASDYYKQNFIRVKNSYYGTTCRYLGDVALQQNKTDDALHYYQQAIIQLKLDFTDTNITHNPSDFIGNFASYELFKAIAAKAKCFQKKYHENKETQAFDNAIATYTSAFSLADYIKKTVDNDEARSFIADNVLASYQSAIDLLMNKQKATQEKALLARALQWISNSRATSLAISLHENNIRESSGIPDSLLQKEQTLKVSMSRFQSALQQVKDSASQAATLSRLHTAELQLHQLIDSYNKYPSYYKQKFANDNIDLGAIQKDLDNATTIICFHKGVSERYAFVISNRSITSVVLNDAKTLDTTINSFINDLQTTIGINLKSPAKTLYNYLLAPLEPFINRSKTLIILPDEGVINLPFETLLIPGDNYLVTRYNILYQYALPFLKSSTATRSNTRIAFAPFTKQVQTNNAFATLSASSEEMASFNENEKYLAKTATKNLFITQAPNAGVIHLATHAKVDYTNPGNSYIAFYPSTNTDTSYKVFAHELSTIDLSQTDLVFLSACETGAGKTSQSEGSLSLSRAFAAAGCKNIVTSLWKAEDEPTAYISKAFYHYVHKGFSYSKALQQAKVDLINDPQMSQYHQPQFWSHLILIGTLPREETNYLLILVLPALVALTAAILFIKAYRKKSPARHF